MGFAFGSWLRHRFAALQAANAPPSFSGKGAKNATILRSHRVENEMSFPSARACRTAC